MSGSIALGSPTYNGNNYSVTYSPDYTVTGGSGTKTYSWTTTATGATWTNQTSPTTDTVTILCSNLSNDTLTGLVSDGNTQTTSNTTAVLVACPPPTTVVLGTGSRPGLVCAGCDSNSSSNSSITSFGAQCNFFALRSGMFASAKLLLKTVPGTVVPPEALRAEGSAYRVFVVENAQACEKLVEVGESGDGWVEIRRGLNPGEKVILSPVATLKDGSLVQL